jgi:hypothetical protein
MGGFASALAARDFRMNGEAEWFSLPKMSWPANAGYPGGFCTPFPNQNTVIARRVRAIHGDPASVEKTSMGGPDTPGHDDLF